MTRLDWTSWRILRTCAHVLNVAAISSGVALIVAVDDGLLLVSFICASVGIAAGTVAVFLDAIADEVRAVLTAETRRATR